LETTLFVTVHGRRPVARIGQPLAFGRVETQGAFALPQPHHREAIFLAAQEQHRPFTHREAGLPLDAHDDAVERSAQLHDGETLAAGTFPGLVHPHVNGGDDVAMLVPGGLHRRHFPHHHPVGVLRELLDVEGQRQRGGRLLSGREQT
jgi:hypothetical protein